MIKIEIIRDALKHLAKLEARALEHFECAVRGNWSDKDFYHGTLVNMLEMRRDLYVWITQKGRGNNFVDSLTGPMLIEMYVEEQNA